MTTLKSSSMALCGSGLIISGLIVLSFAACTPKGDKASATAPDATPVGSAPPASSSPPNVATEPSPVGDPKTAVERNLPALRALLPGLQGSYVEEENGAGNSVIVLDVHATGSEVKAAEDSRVEIERLLGHPVRMNFLDAPLLQQTGGQKPQ